MMRFLIFRHASLALLCIIMIGLADGLMGLHKRLRKTRRDITRAIIGTSPLTCVNIGTSQLMASLLTRDDQAQKEGSSSKSLLDDGRHSDSIAKVIAHFQSGNPNHRRANVILPTGWGETSFAPQLFRQMASPEQRKQQPIRTAIYVTPFLKLADQTLDQLEQFDILRGIPYKCLVVGSDTERPEPRTTSPEVIASFLKEAEQEGSGLRLIVSTMASLRKVGEAMTLIRNRNNDNMRIGLGIFDEAHGMTGIAPTSGFGLMDEELAIDYRLFQTDTPRNFHSTIKQKTVLAAGITNEGATFTVARDDHLNRTDARSFDDESLFGRNVERKTYRHGVEQGITVPLTLCAVSKQELYAIAGYEDLVKNTGTSWTPEMMLPFVLQAAMEKFNVTHVVSFHGNIERSERFAEVARTVLDEKVLAFHVSSKMKRRSQEKILQNAREAPKSVTANCRLLATGVDEASWGMVFIADPLSSPDRIKQVIGRASRPAPNKERGYVLLPYIYDDEVLVDSNSMGYAMLARTFGAMVDENSYLRRDVAYIREQEQELGRELLPSEYPKLLAEAVNLPNSVSIKVQRGTMQRLIVEVGDIWEETYRRFADFKKKHPFDALPNDLRIWANYQRQSKKGGWLGADKVPRLEMVPGFRWRGIEEEWDRKLYYVRQYKEREGHINIPKKCVVDGETIGTWVALQRKRKLDGKLDTYVEEKLNDLGITWHRDEIWARGLEVLARYIQRTGSSWDIPMDYIEDGIRLCTWTKRQRSLNRYGKLDAQRKQQLDDLEGWVWNVLDAKWEVGFQALRSFKRRHGHCNIPYQLKTEIGFYLGQWLYEQRKYNRENKLPESRRRRLQEISAL